MKKKILWYKKRQAYKQNKIKSLNNSHLTFDKDTQNIHWRKDSLLYKWYWKNCRTGFLSLTMYKTQLKMDQGLS
jgi:hypothetical protein